MESRENTFILWEAVKTTHKNGKLVLLIFLLVFLSSSQLELGSMLALKLILDDFASQWPNQNKYTHNIDVSHTGVVQHVHSSQRVHLNSVSYMGEPLSEGQIKYLRDYLGVKLLTLLFSCVILSFFSISIISSSYEAHTAKVMSLKDVFFKFGESWKRPIHTSFFLALIIVGLFVIFAFFTGIIPTIAVGLFVIFAFFTGIIPIIAVGCCVYLLYGILIITGFLTYLHMANIWMLSLVVSVLETESSGLKAIERAEELMKGKKIQPFVLMILFHIAMGAIHVMSGAITKKLDGYTKMAITIPFTIGLICGLKLFMFVVYTVYYHECKMSRKEEVVKGKLFSYVLIAATAEA